jgi:hypothetical protein
MLTSSTRYVLLNVSMTNRKSRRGLYPTPQPFPYEFPAASGGKPEADSNEKAPVKML